MNNTNISPVTVSKLHKVGIPFALRHDSLADTYMGEDGVYLLPMSSHDYAFTALLEAKNMAVGKLVGTNDGRQMIFYGKNVELVSFSALLSSSLDEAEGQRQITDTIQKLIALLTQIKLTTGKLPEIDTTDDVAIDRFSGSIELIAPYILSDTTTVDDLVNRIEKSSIDMFRDDPVNIDTIVNVFADAQETGDE